MEEVNKSHVFFAFHSFVVEFPANVKMLIGVESMMKILFPDDLSIVSLS